LPLSYHLGFIVGLAEAGSSNMVSKLRSWVQFPPGTQFFAARIPRSLASAGPVGTAASEQEQAAPTAATHTQEEEYWTIA
jgi:hypothetical protein